MDINQAVRTFTINNKLGLHARAASLLVQITNKYASEIFVTKNDQEVNGKSIMGILMLAAAKGSQITVKADGQDANDALNAISELIEGKFGED